MAKAQVKAKVVPITPPTLAATPGAKSVRTAMMLGMLSIGMWTGRIGAKDIAHKLEQDAGAKNGTMTTSKKLMNGKAEHEAIGKYATECRNWWATVTVPWFDNGMRGYNAGRHMELMVEIGDRRRTYFGLVEDFMAAYPNLRAQAAFDMGELFNEDEFPSPGDVRKRFRFDFGDEEELNTNSSEWTRQLLGMIQEWDLCFDRKAVNKEALYQTAFQFAQYLEGTA